jgi:hypothetical protein
MFYSQARTPAFTSQTTTFTALSHVQVKREESYSVGGTEKNRFRQTVSLLITNFKVVTEYIIIMIIIIMIIIIIEWVYFPFPCHHISIMYHTVTTAICFIGVKQVFKSSFYTAGDPHYEWVKHHLYTAPSLHSTI